MTTPVNPRVSKLLKEKGFDVEDRTKYQMYGSQVVPQLEPYDDIKWDIYKDYCLAPTIAEVVMWVYKKHGIWISVDCDCYGILWYANLSVASKKNWDNIDLRHEIISASKKFPNEHNSQEKAYEAAIEYCLTKLI